MPVDFVSDTARLRELEPEWQMLADRADVPNVFFEPWFVLSAVKAFDAAVTHIFVRSRETPEKLIGYIPLETGKKRSPLGPSKSETWQNLYFFSGEPLISSGNAREFWDELLIGIDQNRSLGATIRFKVLHQNSASFEGLEQSLLNQRRWFRKYKQFERAILFHWDDEKSYLQKNLTKKKRKEYRRLRRRFEEEGAVTETAFQAGDDVGLWSDEFLALEKKGWKGAQNTALGSQPDSAQFFIEVNKSAAEQGKLNMLKLSFNGQPVAMLVTYVCKPRGSFTFKIAYDETYAKYSPGVLLQLAYLKRALNGEGPPTEWSDSCAAEDHPMINKIWRDRLALVSVKVAPKRPFAKLTTIVEDYTARLINALRK